LVARISGAETRLIAASAEQRARLAEVAAKFSEEDLTRYLQLSLDLFRDLQFSLQPRFHLEIGLVRLVKAGRLLPIEQALADLGAGAPAAAPPRSPAPAAVVPPRAGPSPFEMDRARKARGLAGESAGPTKTTNPEAPAQDARERLHARLSRGGYAHLADAVENARISVSGSDLNIVAEKTYKMYFADPAFADAVREEFGRPMRLNVTVGDSGGKQVPLDAPAEREDEARGRALANPEVQRFQEVFEGSKIHKVRNLKE
jgi:DNA polymerase-3 subunit gamma/tau